MSGDEIVLSRGSRLGFSKDGGRTILMGPALAGTRRDRVADLLPLATRLLRGGIHHVVPIDEDRLLVLAGRLFIQVERRTGRPLGAGQPVIGGRPLNLCRTRAGLIYYGEYRGNPERSPVHIHVTGDGGASWGVAHCFEGIRHIHGVYQDPRDDALWITTGDDDHESAIWRTAGGFDDLTQVWSGTQQARAIPVLFAGDDVVFGSDTPFEINHLFSMQRVGGEPRLLTAVGGSVFHGARVGDWLLFTTAREPSRVNRSPEAEVWCARVSDPARWFLIKSFTKDRWPMKLFQYGQVYLAPGIPREGSVWISPLATVDDQCSLLLAVEGPDRDDERGDRP